ncbi:YkgJ family cysteine cluster protein [Acidobacteria bacterium AB60]|nr:YkgJ family cysteine cluster protein [Acidobacteria bacterium AB60]
MALPSGDAQLVQIMDAALADAARRAGSWLVCREGCTPCCHGAFIINALDVERLRAGMTTLRATDPSLAETLAQRGRAWIAEYGPAFPGDRDTGAIGDSEEDRQAFEEFANEAACPALDPATGRCDVYAWRPMTCRVFGPPVRMGEGEALGCCELCFHGASEAEIASCEMTVPHELEERLLAELDDASPSARETLVAYALLSPVPHATTPPCDKAPCPAR